MPVIDVRDLEIRYRSDSGERVVVDGVGFALEPGASLGIVGESGSGKSVTVMSLVGLAPRGMEVTRGSIRIGGHEYRGATPALRSTLLRDEVGVVFQNPMTALNPRLRIGVQVGEAISGSVSARRHDVAAIIELLARVGIPEPARRLYQFPHELSGGLAQRVVIALALARRPRLLIADEPTTALDVSVQRQLLDLLDELQRELGLATILVSHDLGIIADRTDRVLVLRSGQVVEHGETARVVRSPQHPYTRELLDAVPRLGARQERRDSAALGQRPLAADAVIVADEVSRRFRARRGDRHATVTALDRVSLRVARGRSLGIVGESGSGKTTLSRILVGLDRADSGVVHRDSAADVQFVFQDSSGALDPRTRVVESVAEALERTVRSPSERRARARAALAEVGLAELGGRLPHQLSGGQRQRVGIARALVADPDVIIADEPVSSLDVSVQRSIVELLRRVTRERGLTLVIVSHDLGVIDGLCDEVAVLRDGRLVEVGSVFEVLRRPREAYTRELLAAIPGAALRDSAALLTAGEA